MVMNEGCSYLFCFGFNFRNSRPDLNISSNPENGKQNLAVGRNVSILKNLLLVLTGNLWHMADKTKKKNDPRNY